MMMIIFWSLSLYRQKDGFMKRYVLLIYYTFTNQYRDNVEGKKEMKLDQMLSKLPNTPHCCLYNFNFGAEICQYGWENVCITPTNNCSLGGFSLIWLSSLIDPMKDSFSWKENGNQRLN